MSQNYDKTFVATDMTPKRERTRKVRVVCHLRADSAWTVDVHSLTDENLGF